ncbi:hypothetical protein [Pseudooceanicola sp. MF1-13]|uniref:hypothetical protein n=1 Tax=Pseudooceanicola sp. MF1-13 TaxID=3379095 RepID=UPI00389226B0
MLDPARTVIEKFGGISAVAQLTGRDRSSVQRWGVAKERGGTGGIIPADRHHILLAGARLKGIDLSPADFVVEARIQLAMSELVGRGIGAAAGKDAA